MDEETGRVAIQEERPSYEQVKDIVVFAENLASLVEGTLTRQGVQEHREEIYKGLLPQLLPKEIPLTTHTPEERKTMIKGYIHPIPQTVNQYVKQWKKYHQLWGEQ